MTHTVGTLLAACTLPRTEARALLAHRLQLPRERLVAHPELTVATADAEAFSELARRRADGEPLAYLLGEKEFYGRAFAVTSDVLVPRPETELLVELALERMRPLAQPRVLDLGTGSGCIAVTLALEHRGARVTAIDASSSALAVARGNAERLGAPMELRLGDWYGGCRVGETFDLIVSNPPYIAPDDAHLEALRFEPRHALTDEGDGLRCLAAIAAGAPTRLAPQGWLLVEHGYDQAGQVQALLARTGLAADTRADGAGHPRVTLARRQASV